MRLKILGTLLVLMLVGLPPVRGDVGPIAGSPTNAKVEESKLDHKPVAVAPRTDEVRETSEAYYIRQTAYGTWTLAFATLVLAVGTLFFMRRQVADSNRSAQLHVFLQITDRFESAAMLSARDKVARAILGTGQLNDSCAQSVLDFFEHVGYLTRRGYLDFEMVFNEFVNPACAYWFALHSYVESVRVRLQQKDVYDSAEWLANKLVAVEKTKHGGPSTSSSFTDEVIRQFMHAELDAEKRAPRAYR